MHPPYIIRLKFIGIILFTSSMSNCLSIYWNVKEIAWQLLNPVLFSVNITRISNKMMENEWSIDEKCDLMIATHDLRLEWLIIILRYLPNHFVLCHHFSLWVTYVSYGVIACYSYVRALYLTGFNHSTKQNEYIFIRSIACEIHVFHKIKDMYNESNRSVMKSKERWRKMHLSSWFSLLAFDVIVVMNVLCEMIRQKNK